MLQIKIKEFSSGYKLKLKNLTLDTIKIKEFSAGLGQSLPQC